MKRSISILLLSALLFNVLGFYGFFIGVGYHHDLMFSNRLDNNDYDSRHTITLKIPLAIPYSSDQADFQRVHGQFEYKGTFLKLVKQRLAKDTLYIVCIKDTESKKIHQALTDYVNAVMNNSDNETQSGLPTYSMLKDYCQSAFCLEAVSMGWIHDIEWQHTSQQLHSTFFASIVNPPEGA